MFVRITNGTPELYTIGQLTRDNRDVSFPETIPVEVLADYSVFPLRQTQPPEIDSRTHQHTQDAQLVGGEWVQVWGVVPIQLERAEANVRAARDSLLQSTDWIVIKAYERNQNIPAEWEVYRQALRDITAQEGFPYQVTWPTKP